MARDPRASRLDDDPFAKIDDNQPVNKGTSQHIRVVIQPGQPNPFEPFLKGFFDVDVETIGGENKIKNRVVPLGLILNNYNDDLPQKQHSGNIGIIDIKLFNEFIDLNHKPISNLTRSRKNKLTRNTTKKKM